MVADEKTNGWEKEAKYVSKELERLSKGDEALHVRIGVTEEKLIGKIDVTHDRLSNKITTTRDYLEAKIITTTSSLGTKIDAMDVRLTLLQVKVAGIGAIAGLVVSAAFMFLTYLLRGK